MNAISLYIGYAVIVLGSIFLVGYFCLWALARLQDKFDVGYGKYLRKKTLELNDEEFDKWISNLRRLRKMDMNREGE